MPAGLHADHRRANLCINMSAKSRSVPIVGITMGDAAGIGPEIVLKALTSGAFPKHLRCIVIGDGSVLRRMAAQLNLNISFRQFELEADIREGDVEVFDLENLPQQFQIGIDSALTGKSAAENVVAAVGLWKAGELDAIATAPISKKAISMGGFEFPGHTEFLAELTDTTEFAMSFFAGKLRVVLLSTHLPLISAIKLVKSETLVRLIEFSDRELRKLLGRSVRIAIAGLNPHASEGGMFGAEEEKEIAPAIALCRSKGIEVTGPYAPDTIFMRTHRGEFDACIAMYHDQATIAVKALSFGKGVNVTLGLPLVRTSVDHGTAYDIAGKGIADGSSMREAIVLAGELAWGRDL